MPSSSSTASASREFEITGTFDGVLPMIFDENGGRIVGGRLDSRGARRRTQIYRDQPEGIGPGVAFDLFSDIRYKSMVVRLNGDLAGEFATKLTIDGVSLGESHGLVAGLVHSVFSKVPLRLNVNINGPFRALIQMAKAFKDPTLAIAPVMPFPIDSPALKVEVMNTTKQEEQTTQPAPPAPTAPNVASTWRNEVTTIMENEAARLALGIVARDAAHRLHHGQGAGQADRHQSQRNISQQVVVRLASDVQQMIQKNPEAFPPAPTKPMMRFLDGYRGKRPDRCALRRAIAGGRRQAIQPARSASAMTAISGLPAALAGGASGRFGSKHPSPQPLYRAFDGARTSAADVGIAPAASCSREVRGRRGLYAERRHMAASRRRPVDPVPDYCR